MPLLLGNKIHLPSEMLEEILLYPNVPDMRKTRPSIRAMEIACDNLLGENASPSQWCDDFWTINFASTDCLIPRSVSEGDSYSPSDYERFIEHHRKKLTAIRLTNE